MSPGDLAYGLVSDLIGEPLPDAGLGDLTADAVNNGIDLAVTGYDSAIALLAGVNANNNFGGGINASLTSTDVNSGLLGGGAMAFLVDVDANFNVTGDGIALDLATTDQGNITAGLVDIHADMNGLRGLELTANSLDGSAIALLSDVNVQQNGAVGIYADLTAAQDAGLAVTDSDSVGNTGRGLNAQLNAGEDAYFFAGDFAAEDLDNVFNFGADLGPLVDLIPTGAVDFSGNGNGGLFLDAVSTGGDVILGLNGATANNNGNMGFNLNLTAANGDILGDVLWTAATNNGGHGLTLDLAGGGGNSGVMLTRVTTADNGGNGLNILDNYTGNLFVGGELLTSVTMPPTACASSPTAPASWNWTSAAAAPLARPQLVLRQRQPRLPLQQRNGDHPVDAQNNWWGVAPPAAGAVCRQHLWDNWLLAAPEPSRRFFQPLPPGGASLASSDCPLSPSPRAKKQPRPQSGRGRQPPVHVVPRQVPARLVHRPRGPPPRSRRRLQSHRGQLCAPRSSAHCRWAMPASPGSSGMRCCSSSQQGPDVGQGLLPAHAVQQHMAMTVRPELHQPLAPISRICPVRNSPSRRFHPVARPPAAGGDAFLRSISSSGRPAVCHQNGTRFSTASVN